MRYQFPVCFCLIAAMFCLAPSTQAETLADVMNSERMSEFVVTSRDIAAKNERQGGFQWIKTGTGMDQLFHRTKGNPGVMIDWLGLRLSAFSVVSRNQTKTNEFARAQATYGNNENESVNVTVLVAHPKFKSMIKYGLMNEFNALTPLKTDVALTEKMNIKGSETTLYQMKNGSCSMNVQIDEGVLLQTQIIDCEKINRLVEFTQKLDVVRLQRKLET